MIKRALVILLFATFSGEVFSGSDASLHLVANRFFTPMPDQMPNSEGDSDAIISLGQALYFETALSINRSQSCHSCHRLTDGGAGVDNLITSRGALGEHGKRNSPSTWNAGFQFVQFWDGRAKNLVEQARSPLLNPVEMAMPSEAVVVSRLIEENYQSRFKMAFPAQEVPVTFTNVLEAIAAFQRTLITQDRFDKYLKGDITALSVPEKRGMRTFINNGCVACHTGPLMGGQLFMKMGIVNAYPNTQDKGRAEVTGNSADNYLFKVPSLRNVAQTAPYFHDGAGKTLEQAIIDTAWHQLGTKLTTEQVKDIELFLRSLNNTKLFIE